MSSQGRNGSFTLLDVVRTLHGALTRVVDASICFFGVFDEAAQVVDVVWQVQDGVELGGGTFPLGSGLTSQVIRERRPRLVDNWSRGGPPVQVQYATQQPALLESAITVPVLHDHRVLGVVAVQSHRSGAFQPHHVLLVQQVVDAATPDIAAALQMKSSAIGALLSEARGAAIIVDADARLLGMNEAARLLLSLQEHPILFGHPIDRPQAGRWPLGSETLTDALLPVVRGLRQELTIPTTGNRTVVCSAAPVFNAESPVGAMLTFR